MGTMPNPNLPNEATPWGKWVIGQIESLLDSAGRRNLNATNSGKAQNATTEALGEQIQDLQQTIVTLEQTVANVSALALNQVLPQAATNGATGFGVSTGAGAYTSLTFTTPSGYTRALVSGVASFTITNFSGALDRFFGSVTINGSGGPEQAMNVSDFNTAPFADTVENVAAANSLLISGLGSGVTFNVQAVGHTAARNFGSNALNAATISAQVIYLK